MRLPVSLHLVAGFLLVLAVVLAETEGKKVIEKKEDLKKPETNLVVTEKPTLFGFIRRLLPEKTLEKLRAAVTAKPKSKPKTSKPKSKSSKKATTPVTTAAPAKVKNGRSIKTLKKVKSTKKMPTTTAPLKKSKVSSNNKLRSHSKGTSTPIPKQKPKSKQVSPKQKKSTTGKTTLKPKTPRYLSVRGRQNDRLSAFNSHAPPPTPAETEVLPVAMEQKSTRLRQELIRETEDNCLAKILCGSKGTKPKPKEKNTFVSDTAYLIKEFFNIFDFTLDEAPPTIKKATDSEKVSNDDDEDATAEEGDDVDVDADDEEEDIYRTNPIDDKPKKNRYTTNKTKMNSNDTHKTTLSKPPATERMSETTTTSTIPTTTTRRPRPVSMAPHEDLATTVGDLVPIAPSTSKYHTENRLGEYSTQSSGLLTSTIISTSMTGSAAVKPMGLHFAIPLKTAKDKADLDGLDVDDDDEEDDNPRYSDDRFEDNEDGDNFHRVTLEELVGDIKLNPNDFAMLRRGRSMKISLSNVTSDKYIQSKLRQLKTVGNEVKKLRIAQKVARSMREPRQCRQFSQVAEEVLQTCPLTTEVIRFFNTNLRNGTSLEVKKTPQTTNSTGGGLVVLNSDIDGTQQAYFVDNHANNANTKVTTDLKNPSVPSSYNQEEVNYPIYESRPNPNIQNSHLDQTGQDIRRPIQQLQQQQQQQQNTDNSSEEANDDEESDEERDEDIDDDDAEGRRNDDYDEDGELYDDVDGEESGEDDEEQGDDEDEDNSTDDVSRDREPNLKNVSKPQQQQKNYEKIQGTETNQPNIKIAIRPKPLKRPVPAPPTLPPGIIRVYGVPTSSFDRDFSEIADKIGSKPVTIFGEEDIDRPAYNTKKKRRQLGYRISKNAKHGEQDDEDVEIENVAFSSRVPKHPPVHPLETEPYVNDGEDDDDEDQNKIAYQNPKKNNGNNGGKPLGGIKGASGDDDDDDDDDKKGSSEKKRNKSKEEEEKGSGEHIPPPSVVIDDPPFVPSMMYSSSVLPQQQLSQPQPSPHEYYHHQSYNPYPTQGYQVDHYHHHSQYSHSQPFHRPRPTGYRPIVRPIKIIPGAGFYRPGRLYPLYG